MTQHAGKCRNKTITKNDITNLVIATRIKQESTPNKSESQRKIIIKNESKRQRKKYANECAICACNTEANLVSGDNNISGDT